MRNRIIYTHYSGGEPKRQRRTRLPLRYLIVGSAIICAVAGAITLLRIDALQIRTVTFAGVNSNSLNEATLRSSVLAELSGSRLLIFPRTSFFLANTSAIEKRLKTDFPRIESVTAVKEFPFKIHISLVERTFWGVFCNGMAGSSTPACAYIDPHGIAYQASAEPEGTLIISIHSDTRDDIHIGERVVDASLMEELTVFSEKLPASANIHIADFELHTRIPSEIRARTVDGFILIFKRGGDIASTLHVLKRVLESEIKDQRRRLDYIDLRFGNKVFYKLR